MTEYNYDGTDNEALIDWLNSLRNNTGYDSFQLRKVMSLSQVTFEIVINEKVIALLSDNCFKLLTFKRYQDLFEKVKQDFLTAMHNRELYDFPHEVLIARDDVILRA